MCDRRCRTEESELGLSITREFCGGEAVGMRALTVNFTGAISLSCQKKGAEIVRRRGEGERESPKVDVRYAFPDSLQMFILQLGN